MLDTSLRARPEAAEPIAAMKELPCLEELPSWARTDADAAIARWTAACVAEDRSAAARAAHAAVLAVLH
jgi:hypothetical protein